MRGCSGSGRSWCPMSKHRVVPVNERGYCIGECHHNSTISDAVVTLIRDLREEHKLTIPEIARRTGVEFEAVRKIVYYRTRGQVPRGFKRVEGECETKP